MATTMEMRTARFSGGLVAECPVCHTVCVSWDEDDLNDEGQLECVSTRCTENKKGN